MGGVGVEMCIFEVWLYIGFGLFGLEDWVEIVIGIIFKIRFWYIDFVVKVLCVLVLEINKEIKNSVFWFLLCF